MLVYQRVSVVVVVQPLHQSEGADIFLHHFSSWIPTVRLSKARMVNVVNKAFFEPKHQETWRVINPNILRTFWSRIIATIYPSCEDRRVRHPSPVRTRATLSRVAPGPCCGAGCSWQDLSAVQVEAQKGERVSWWLNLLGDELILNKVVMVIIQYIYIYIYYIWLCID